MDSAEFGKLYSQYHARFVVIARRYVRNKAIAEDLVMDSFATFWENRDGAVAAAANKPAYLFTIVKNKCLDWLKTQQLRMRIEQTLHTQQLRMTDASIRSLELCQPDELFADEVVRIVRRELAAMPELTRTVFEANRFLNKTYAEIAEELGIPPRRVTTEISKALVILRKALADYLPAHIIMLLLKDLN